MSEHDVVAVARLVAEVEPDQPLLLLDRLNDLRVALWELDNAAPDEGEA